MNLFGKLFLLCMGLSVALTGGFLALGMSSHRQEINRQVEQRLLDSAIVLRSHVRSGLSVILDPESDAQQKSISSQYLQQLLPALAVETGTRMTLIDSLGTVLADSERSPDEMMNHADRSELIQAAETGKGVATRKSPTLQLDMHYLALLVETQPGQRAFVRVAVRLDAINQRVAAVGRRLFALSLALGVIATALVYGIVRRIISPLAQLTQRAQAIADGKDEVPVPVSSQDEIGQLSESFNQMQGQLAKRFRQLHEQNQQLRRLENLRQELVANVSHELKTPLASIKAYAETLRLGAMDDPENNVRFVQQIEEQAERLHQLILDMLQVARIESGEIAFEITQVNLEQAVASSLDQYREAAQRKQIQLIAESSDPLIFAQADEEGVQVILENLIGNAIKYTPKGGQVTIRSYVDENDAVLEVQDTGIGIAQEDQSRVFERFFRVDRARSRELGGTGLGLSIVKHLSQALGGSVTLESGVRRGSTFRVRLPRR